MENSSNRIAEELLKHRNSPREVQIFPHIRVDGDCLGSAAALAAVLSRLQIRARVFMDEPVPDRLSFLEIRPELMEVFDSGKWDSYLADQGAVIAVDCSDSARMGRSGALFQHASENMVIDHHISSGNSHGCRYIDANAAATAELVLAVIHILEERTGTDLIDPSAANCLMVGLQSDTGRFSYQNTTPGTFRAAAELLEKGANVYINAYNLFDLTNVERMRLTARALSGAKFFYGGRLALTVVTQDMIRECQATEDASDGLASNLRDIKGVLASFAVRETADGEIRVNIRSYLPFDAAVFAAQFGGGGHQRAAGFTVQNRTATEVSKMIIERAGEFLSETN